MMRWYNKTPKAKRTKLEWRRIKSIANHVERSMTFNVRVWFKWGPVQWACDPSKVNFGVDMATPGADRTVCVPVKLGAPALKDWPTQYQQIPRPSPCHNCQDFIGGPYDCCKRCICEKRGY